jgi:hypothetical protein
VSGIVDPKICERSKILLNCYSIVIVNVSALFILFITELLLVTPILFSIR